MNQTTKDHDERLKLHEAIAVTALVAFLAISVTISFGALALRAVVVDAVDQFKQKGS